MRIRWTVPAADNLEGIHEYLKQHHPHLANSTITEIHKAIRSLKRFPHRGRKGLKRVRGNCCMSDCLISLPIA